MKNMTIDAETNNYLKTDTAFGNPLDSTNITRNFPPKYIKIPFKTIPKNCELYHKDKAPSLNEEGTYNFQLSSINDQLVDSTSESYESAINDCPNKQSNQEDDVKERKSDARKSGRCWNLFERMYLERSSLFHTLLGLFIWLTALSVCLTTIGLPDIPSKIEYWRWLLFISCIFTTFGIFITLSTLVKLLLVKIHISAKLYYHCITSLLYFGILLSSYLYYLFIFYHLYEAYIRPIEQWIVLIIRILLIISLIFSSQYLISSIIIVTLRHYSIYSRYSQLRELTIRKRFINLLNRYCLMVSHLEQSIKSSGQEKIILNFMGEYSHDINSSSSPNNENREEDYIDVCRPEEYDTKTTRIPQKNHIAHPSQNIESFEFRLFNSNCSIRLPNWEIDSNCTRVSSFDLMDSLDHEIGGLNEIDCSIFIDRDKYFNGLLLWINNQYKLCHNTHTVRQFVTIFESQLIRYIHFCNAWIILKFPYPSENLLILHSLLYLIWPLKLSYFHCSSRLNDQFFEPSSYNTATSTKNQILPIIQEYIKNISYREFKSYNALFNPMDKPEYNSKKVEIFFTETLALNEKIDTAMNINESCLKKLERISLIVMSTLTPLIYSLISTIPTYIKIGLNLIILLILVYIGFKTFSIIKIYIFLLIEHPFDINDEVIFDSEEHLTKILNINTQDTLIKPIKSSEVMIPNHVIKKYKVINFTKLYKKVGLDLYYQISSKHWNDYLERWLSLVLIEFCSFHDFWVSSPRPTSRYHTTHPTKQEVYVNISLAYRYFYNSQPNIQSNIKELEDYMEKRLGKLFIPIEFPAFNNYTHMNNIQPRRLFNTNNRI